MAQFVVKESKDGRKEYRFVLVVNGNIMGSCPLGGWYDLTGMWNVKGGIAWGARCFRKTAGVLVYEHGERDGHECWHYCDHCELNLWDVNGMEYYYTDETFPKIINF